ncbi:MAG: hypothetical protein WAN65_25520 [Candidatus Sulfotelmatobacter sp.]
MRRIVVSALSLAVAALFTSCSSSSKIPDAPMPNVAGPWEFIASSTTSPGFSTGIEAALQEAQVFSTQTGTFVSTGQISAGGAQVNFVALNGLKNGVPSTIGFAGNCTAATIDPTTGVTSGNSLTGSISGLAGSMNFTYVEGGNVFMVTGDLSADGKSMMGTYTEQAAETGNTNGTCNGDGTILDQGNITGTVVSKLSGTYTGKICEPLDSSCAAGAKDSATATLSENSSGTLTVSVVLTGADNASITLQGPVTGNFISVQGTFNGQTVVYEGYTENIPSGNFIVPTLYLANLDINSSTPAATYAGTLIVPQTQ